VKVPGTRVSGNARTSISIVAKIEMMVIVRTRDLVPGLLRHCVISCARVFPSGNIGNAHTEITSIAWATETPWGSHDVLRLFEPSRIKVRTCEPPEFLLLRVDLEEMSHEFTGTHVQPGF
jgi:hypothetical protein